MTNGPSVLLHVHSHYSLMKGVDGPEALLRRAAACGYAALALTDTNNLYGAVAFAETARRHGVRPILGACLRQERQRCVALIAEPEGYRSLCRVISRLHLQERPSLASLLAECAAGLHVLTDDVVIADRLREAFGARLWLEVVRPGGPQPRERELLELGRRLGLRPVASVATHFAGPEGAEVFRLITAAGRGTLLDRLPARLPITAAHHLVTPEVLHQRFRDLPEAVVNTQRLAEQCRSDVLPRGFLLPPARVPRAYDTIGYLGLLCERGLRRRRLGDDATTRLGQELRLIVEGGLAGYFLVVRDIAREARRRGFGMALRGSAGNSLVCYLLGITAVDPLRFDLPLERFLHAGRPDLPDIDLDFDWKVRDRIIDYVFTRYGAAHTAMISSHLFLQPRSAFREAAKVHGLSNEQITRLLETLSQRVDELLSGGDALGRPPRAFPLEPQRWPRLLADARRLLDRPHHLSIHPGGVVITAGPLEDHAPLQRAAKGVVITQFEKDAAEHVGLVKIDLLGNRALSTVDEARQLVAGRADVSPSSNGADRQDGGPTGVDRTLSLLQCGETMGVNQLESPAMRHLLVQMRPRGLLDVIQSLALIRPGAASVGAKESFIRRRRGLEPITYHDPRLEPLLRDTCGLMLYEDDALRVVHALTGLPLPAADHFRKQITHCQDDKESAALAQAFLAACGRNSVPRPAAEAVWVQLAKFNHYSFCKSHAVSYGLIAWEAATLKVRHPLPFWVAALNNNQGMYPRRVYVEAAKRMGIRFLLPCVNRSERMFALEGEVVRTGLGVIASLPDAALGELLEERGQRGPYAGMADFRQRVNVGPEALAVLIQVGAFDFTDRPRSALMLEAALNEEDGTLFSGLSPSYDSWPGDWAPADYPLARQWRDEWQRLGFLAGPPLMGVFRPYVPAGICDSRSLVARVGRRVRLAGLVAASRHTPTKRGEDMQFITLEDEWGLVEVTIFPGACPLVPYLSMGPYLVEGNVEKQHGVMTLNASAIEAVKLATPTAAAAG